jgi:hypothetical protein
MKIAIMQPYFLPYLGYFQLIASVDKFVIYDDVSFIKRGWINRNHINIQGQAKLITVPLQNGNRGVPICDVRIGGKKDFWPRKMLRTVELAYSKAPMFSEVFPWFEQLLLSSGDLISRVNVAAIRWVCDRCFLETDIVETSRRYANGELDRVARLADICKCELADCYINAKGGQALYTQSMFNSYGIRLRFLDPELIPYRQCSKDFIPGLSILDVLMNCEPSEINQMMRVGRLIE